MADVRRRLGIIDLGGKDIAVVWRNGRFHRLERGPKELRIVPMVEKVAYIVDGTPDAFKFFSENIQTHDGLLVRVETRVEYMFDPQKLDISKQSGMCKRCQFVADRQEIVRDQTRRALQEVVSAYPAIVVCSQGYMWHVIENQWRERLKPLLAVYGFTMFEERCSIMEILPPDSVRQRIELSAERLINAMMLNQLNPADQARVLRAEAIESLRHMAGAAPTLNISDMPEPYGDVEADPDARLNRISDTNALPPASGPIIISTPRPVEPVVPVVPVENKPPQNDPAKNANTNIIDDDEPYSLME